MANRASKYNDALSLLDDGYKKIEELERNLVALHQQPTDAGSDCANGSAPGAALRAAQIHQAFVALRKTYLATASAVLGCGIVIEPDYVSSSEE